MERRGSCSSTVTILDPNSNQEHFLALIIRPDTANGQKLSCLLRNLFPSEVRLVLVRSTESFAINQISTMGRKSNSSQDKSNRKLQSLVKKYKEDNPPFEDVEADNRKLYCFCQKTEDEADGGEMIECTNARNGSCLIEWCHLACIGMNSAPAGKNESLCCNFVSILTISRGLVLQILQRQ